MESGELLRRSGPSIGSKPDDRGGWRAAFYLVGMVAFLERLGFYGVQANLIMYLTGPLGMPTAAAAAGVNAWAGTVLVLPLVGALAADSRLGRYRAVLVAGVLYLLSLGMLTVSSALQTARSVSSAPSTSPAHLTFTYVALYLLALAQGFHRPCAEALGADQFALSDGDPSSRASRSSYFNWFHFSISWGYLLSETVLSYLEDNAGWTAGFGACWTTMFLSLAVFLLGARTYRAKRPVHDGQFVDTVRAWAARVFRRKDASSNERLLSRQPGEGKGVVAKLLPIWLAAMFYSSITSQMYTLFTKQGSTLDRRLATGLVVPPAALQCLASFTFIAVLPVYDRGVVPLARHVTGHHAGVTTLQRIGTGMAMSCVSMVVAALVEGRRLRVAMDAGLVDRPDVTLPMSLWWVVPQYVLLGLAMALADVGLEEFFYDQVPDAVRSVGLALCLSAMGAGSYVSGMLVSTVDWATRARGESWISDNLNRAHLDYFYWLLAGLAALVVAVFLHFSNRFVYRSKWVEISERFAYSGISGNLITYLTGPLGQSTASAAAAINAWSGAALMLPLLGAAVADSWLGPCAQGGHKPCVQAFGADQFDENDPEECASRSSFFNWWYFALVEMRRLKIARDYSLVDKPEVTIPMSVWWVVPQYILSGLADVFTMVGLQEFFYGQVPDGLRSLGLAEHIWNWELYQ
ncbi:hypothetical protein HU200_026264 [Digitaria exilis]|uniref:Uncharacterized protein n=1 Tax=Digitaria exilis TaxID=1010633 RepID=A0A835BZE3_9POAL|nr:hypothetical protein HU200_026264 [Digitaria exilis]